MDKNTGKGFKVRSDRCSTCIFGANSPIPPERFQELLRTWGEENRAQECHQHTVVGEKVGCAGHYQAAREGRVPHPVSAIAEEEFGGLLALSDAFTVYERLGLVIVIKDTE